MYRIDHREEAVREVQTYLRTLAGFFDELPVLAVDGIYGDETREAVRIFQRKTGLIETGDTDGETFALLFSMYTDVKEPEEGAGVLLPSRIFPLRLGDSGSYVRILQAVLGEVLERHTPQDGFFSRTTEDAVREAETRYAMPRTGSASYALWLALSEEYRTLLAKKLIT